MKWYVYAISLSLFVSPALAQQKSITLTVEVSEAQLLLNALSQGAWKDTNPLMQKLIGQVNAQMAPPKPSEAPSTPPEGGSPPEK